MNCNLFFMEQRRNKSIPSSLHNGSFLNVTSYNFRRRNLLSFPTSIFIFLEINSKHYTVFHV